MVPDFIVADPDGVGVRFASCLQTPRRADMATIPKDSLPLCEHDIGSIWTVTRYGSDGNVRRSGTAAESAISMANGGAVASRWSLSSQLLRPQARGSGPHSPCSQCAASSPHSAWR
jgi:hypothetical protein